MTVERSPPNARYRAQPGDTLSGTLSLRNTSDGPVSLTAFPSDFVLAADGAIHPLPAASLPTSLTSWLTVNATDVTIPGNSTQDVRYSVTVPPDTQGGTYWAAVLFKTDTPQGPTDASGHNVGIRYVAQLAYVILVDVGDLSPAGKVADISLAQAPSDSQQGQTVRVTFQNTGNAYMLVSGRVEIHQLDGTLVGSYPMTRTASLPGELSHLTVEPSPRCPRVTTWRPPCWTTARPTRSQARRNSTCHDPIGVILAIALLPLTAWSCAQAVPDATGGGVLHVEEQPISIDVPAPPSLPRAIQPPSTSRRRSPRRSWPACRPPACGCWRSPSSHRFGSRSRSRPSPVPALNTA